MSSELITSPEAAESKLQYLVEQFRNSPASELETYAAFGVDGTTEAAEHRAAQKEYFLSGDVHNPKLNHPVLEQRDKEAELIAMEQSLLGLMMESTDIAHDGDRESALYDLLRLKFLDVAMLQVSRKINQSETSETERLELAELFNLANDEVHGKLEQPRFNGLINKVRQDAEQLINEKVPEEVQEAAGYYVSNAGLINSESGAIEPVKADPAEFAKLQIYVKEKFADLIACVPEKPEGETLSIEELAEVFRKAHQSRDTGWEVLIQPGQRNVDTRQSQLTTIIGAERKLPTVVQTAGLVVHENGVHVEKRRRGDASGDALLKGLGLAKSIDSEEGLAGILQRCIDGEISEPGVQYYTALGLARGLDGKKRDFREVYELEWRRRLIVEYSEKSSIDDNRITKLKSLAYNTCERIFRGTPCDIPGMVYTKDQAYFMGSQKMWELMLDIVNLPSSEKDQAFDALFAAKYDPTNPLHCRLVQKVIK